MNLRSLLLCAVLLAGCVPGVAIDDAGITADLACEAARSAVLLSHQITPAPKPPAPPSPTPGKCSRCNGSGLLPTDGRIRIECPDCRGTGKQTVSVLKPNCPDGKCKP